MALQPADYKYDVVFRMGTAAAVGSAIAAHLETKGFAVCDPGVSEEIFKKACSDVAECADQGKLSPPPVQIVDGLLGAEGSARVMELESRDDMIEDGISKLDALMTETASFIKRPLSQKLGLVTPTRTPGILNEAGLPEDDGPAITEAKATEWLSTFTRHRVMILVIVGPIKGTLQLDPFDEEAEAFEIATVPGSVIVLRADMMSHKHCAPSKAHVLSCFLLEARPMKRDAVPIVYQTPVAQQLEQWALERMKIIKEEEANTGISTGVPQSWTAAMNHMYHTTQRVAVRGHAGRYASTWSTDIWYRSMTSGVDLVTQIPYVRWQVDEYYDAHPEGWRWQKCYLKHGSFMDGADLFDCRFFSLSPAEAAGMDPHQREVLEVGYEALNMAGYKKGKLMNSLGGVYLGSSMTIFGMVSQVSGATGGAASINSNRFSFCLGLKGPSLTCDTDGSSALTAIYIGAEAVLDKGRGQINAYSLSGGVHFQLGTIWWPQLQAAGMLNPQGRCFTFDQSADGYCHGDGCGFVVLKRLTELVDGQAVYIEGEPDNGVIAGAACNSNGINSAMNAPSGPTEMELVMEAVKQAGISPLNVDAVECNGQGAFIADAVEVDSLARVLRGQDFDEPLGITSVKARMGHCSEAAGVVSFHRALLGNNFGAMLPNCHLHQLNPHMEPENKCNFITESLEYAMTTSYTGVTSRGFGGTNVHVIAWGQVSQYRAPANPDASVPGVVFWPGGGGELEDHVVPIRGYHIIGSWSRWQPEKMQDEGVGSYGFTVTLGENRFEEFQILLDGDRRRVLHPEQPKAPKGAVICGPDSNVKGLNWRINGLTQWVELTPEEEEARRSTEVAAAIQDASNPDAPVLQAGAPTYMEVDSVDKGKPGDKYRVHVKVAGKYRAVVWEKLPEDQSDPSAVREGDYFVVADWNGWKCEPMSKEGATWVFEVLLLRPGGEFQIVRDGDWGQVFCPSPVSDGMGYGPDDAMATRGVNWLLDGAPGDVIRIEFRRRTTDELGPKGLEVTEVSWNKVREEKLTQDQMRSARRPRFGVAGTWGGWVGPQSELSYLPASQQHAFFVEIGPDGEESFQLLQDLNWNRIIHPNRPVGTGQAHFVQLTVPNDGSAMDLVWTIGVNDQANPGEVFMVVVSAIRDMVSNVTWSRAVGDDLDHARSTGAILRRE